MLGQYSGLIGLVETQVLESEPMAWTSGICFLDDLTDRGMKLEDGTTKMDEKIKILFKKKKNKKQEETSKMVM